MNAYDDLIAELDEGESVEGIIFGDWGWSGFAEPAPPPIPQNIKARVLSLKDAAPFMEEWSFYGDHGSPKCYATYIWTNKRVLWVTQYDGATSLGSAPRNPLSGIMPDMPGG